MSAICQSLSWRTHLAIAVPLVSTCVLWLCSDCFAWSASAVGRLLLIQILPYWDWTIYYNAQCLIVRDNQQSVTSKELSKYETIVENCALCESLDTIPTVENATYSMLESQYLERGLPVIITDARERVQLTLDALLELIYRKAPELLSSNPCDVTNNLLLPKLFSVDAAIQKLSMLPISSSWYLQLRNCQFSAVKASRLYMRRPYYYPVHLEPYYSSWLLMAHNVMRSQSEIYLRGLIFVQQLNGNFDIQLRPKEPCDGTICPSLRLRLLAGECLVFSTDLWRFSYGVTTKSNLDITSIATILEVDWQM